MKDQHGKPLSRDFAPKKRPTTEDKYKVTVVKKESDYKVSKDQNGRPRVTKKS